MNIRVVRSIRIVYLILIPLTLGLMILHNLLDFLGKLRRGARRQRRDREEVPRMNLHFRIAHALVIVSFPLLVITGFALKYPEAWWAAPLLRFEDGFTSGAACTALPRCSLIAVLRLPRDAPDPGPARIASSCARCGRASRMRPISSG